MFLLRLCQEMVEFDPESGWLLLVKLTKFAKAKKGAVPFFKASKKSAGLAMYVCKVQGMNAEAKAVLQLIHSAKMDGLMSRIRDLPLFAK